MISQVYCNPNPTVPVLSGKRLSLGGEIRQGRICGCLLSTYDIQNAATCWVPVCKWEFLTLAVLWALGKGLLPLELGGFQRSSTINGSIEKAGGMDRVALMGWTEQL